MKKLISFKMAVRLTLILFMLFTLFHVLVLLRYVPDTIIWGGKIKDPAMLKFMEAVSAFVLLLSACTVLSKARILFGKFSRRADKLIWLLPLLFALNSIGNMMAENLFERLVFTPVTLLLTLLTLRIALEKFSDEPAIIQ